MEGMLDSLMKCIIEVQNSQTMYMSKANGKVCESLLERRDHIRKIQKELHDLNEETPWIFQKCSMRGLILAKECISKIREESNVLC